MRKMTLSPFASVLLLKDVKTDQGTPVKEGTQGTLIEQDADGFVVEFRIFCADCPTGTEHHFEAALLSPDSFAITEILENTLTQDE